MNHLELAKSTTYDSAPNANEISFGILHALIAIAEQLKIANNVAVTVAYEDEKINDFQHSKFIQREDK